MELANIIQLVASSVLIVISLCIIHIITELRNENEHRNNITQKLKTKIGEFQDNIIDLDISIEALVRKQAEREEAEKKIEKFIEEQNAKKADTEEASFYE